MRTTVRWTAIRRLANAGTLLAGVGLCSCGGQPSLAERMTGTYATAAVQADLEEHEKELVSADLHGRFDSLDKEEAALGGTVWARLRLEGDGRFTYEGPATSDGPADARIEGRWTARPGFVDLVVAKASGTGADGVARSIACPASAGAVDLPFLPDPSGRGPVRLARR